MTNPISVTGTRRQRVVTRAGVTLERQALYLPPETWQALQRICVVDRQSGSHVIQHLIELADRGNPVKEKHNERSSTAEQRRD
jgi:hypothetical protein